jgi:hypothetical protein
MEDGVTPPPRREGVDRSAADDADVFRALVRSLDDAPAKAGSTLLTGWHDIGERLAIRILMLNPLRLRPPGGATTEALRADVQN